MRTLSGILFFLFALIAALLPFLPAAAQTPEARAYPALFDTSEARSSRLLPFQKWTGMLNRQHDERELYDGPCTARRFNRCHLQEWRALLKNLAVQDRLTQITAINDFINRAPYIEDLVNYGVPDYWASPLQFMAKDGDCEDYAIAKFMSLRELGFANDDLRVVVVEDLNLQVPHAVLAVYDGERALILDNQIPQIVPAGVIRHYRPIYSINEEAWWLHRSVADSGRAPRPTR
jgi:predicted transglutaminase-like cysteine proteinase